MERLVGCKSQTIHGYILNRFLDKQGMKCIDHNIFAVSKGKFGMIDRQNINDEGMVAGNADNHFPYHVAISSTLKEHLLPCFVYRFFAGKRVK